MQNHRKSKNPCVPRVFRGADGGIRTRDLILTNSKTMTFEPEPTEAEVVREIFSLYNDGWGYKRIAEHLTDKHIPTPRMNERTRKEAHGEDCKIKARPEWSIATVQGILQNDFYIGTLRQGKYTRKKTTAAT